MDKTRQVIRLENLIKSNQNVFNACCGDFEQKGQCSLVYDYQRFKCCYFVNDLCTFPKKDLKGYN